MAWTECGTGGGGGYDARGDRLLTLDYSPSIAIRSRINFFMLGGLCRNVAFLQYAVRDMGEAEWQRALEIQTGTRSVNQDPLPRPRPHPPRLLASHDCELLDTRERFRVASTEFEQRGRLETLVGSQCCHDVLASSPGVCCGDSHFSDSGFSLWRIRFSRRMTGCSYRSQSASGSPAPLSPSLSRLYSRIARLCLRILLHDTPGKMQRAVLPQATLSGRSLGPAQELSPPSLLPPPCPAVRPIPLSLRTDRHLGGADAPAHCHPGSLFDHTELKLDTASKQEIRRVHPFVQAYLEARTEGKGEDKAKKDLLGSSSSARLIDWISERR